jgi:oxygen-independent coproporphyrinogen-3 oxidase
VHLPWCVRKCPYCDFNSHAWREPVPQTQYVDALLRDLEHDLPRVYGRAVRTVFIGGGTPSLFAPEAIDRLLSGLRARVALAPDAEITLEANPGTVDSARFAGYRAAGVNRLSIGVQSFDDDKLRALGRIHGGAQARAAAQAAQAAGFDNFNLDLMYGLPGQTSEQALADLRVAIELAPTHLSVYQLTIEPNTLFHARPPRLPDDDALLDMHEQLAAVLAEHGFRNYEVSAYARHGQACAHNLNYWRYGDYLGIGAGAHAKITQPETITRLWKVKQPQRYLDAAGGAAAVGGETCIGAADAAFEFMLNALRLTDGVALELFHARTGLPLDMIGSVLAAAQQRGLLNRSASRLQATALGRRFLNDLTALFLPAEAA